MKLCQNLNLLLKRLEIDKINFWMDFFLKVDLIGCFRELHVRKFRKFSPDHFYDLKNRFYDKKTDFRPETRKSQFPEIATCRPCNRE